ncbi:MAG: hypothetical protein JWN04_1119 [Myxococcaceae bacterium]|nr:hypothetical protein [Myxococcaceae bacterium]
MSAQKSLAQRLLRPLGVLSLVLALSAFALWYAPRTAPIRGLVRIELEQLLDGLLQGEVQIDRIAHLSLGGVEAEGVTVRDAAGRTVLRAKRLELGLDALALLRLRLRFTHGLLEDAHVRAYPSEVAALSLFEALAPVPSEPKRDEPKTSGGLDILFEHIHVRRAHFYGDVPGLANIEVSELEARGELRIIDGELSVRVSAAHGTMTAPYDTTIALEQANFALDTTPLRLRVKARASASDSRVHAALSYRSPVLDAERLDLLVSLEPVTPELLATLHVAPAQILLSSVRGYARLSGPLANLSFFAAPLRTDAGLISLHGQLPREKPTIVVIESGPLELEKLLAYAPPVRLQTQIDVLVEHGKVSLHLRSPLVSLYGVDLRDADIAANYVGERLSLSRARVSYGGGHLDVSGSIYSDGALALRVRSQVPDIARARSIRESGVRGGLRTDVRIEHDAQKLSIDGSVGLVAPSYGKFSVSKELVIEGRASADDDLSHLRVAAKGASWGTTFLDYQIGDFEYTIGGSYPRFTADFGLIDRRARTADAHLELTIEDNGDLHVLLSPLTVGVQGREPWRARADVVFEHDGIDFRQVFLANGAQRLDLAGRYSYSKAYRVEATLQSFDLGGLRELSGLDLADLDGTIDGKLSLTGVPGHPRIDAAGALRSGIFLGLSDLAATLSLKAFDGRFDINAELVLPDKSRFGLYAGGEPGAGETWLKQLASGNYQFGLDFERVKFEAARAWLGWMGDAPPPGTLSATVRGAGSLAAPELDVECQVEGLELDGMPPMTIALALEHDGKRATLHALKVSDPHGPVGMLSGFLDASARELLDPLGLRASLAKRAFELDLAWENRRLDELPGPLHVKLALPSSGTVRVAQTDTGPTLDLSTRLGWPANTRGLDACGTDRHPELELTLSARDGRTTGKLVANLDSEQLAMADAEADTPIEQWITGERALFWPRTSFTLDADTKAAEEVPGLCEFLAGPVQLEVSALDAFADPPELHFQLRSTALQLVASQSQRGRLGAMRDARSTGKPFALSASGGVDGASFTLRAEIDQGEGAHLMIDGSLPRAALIADGSAPSSWPLAKADIAAEKVDLAALLLALPISVRGAGQIDGGAQARYDFARDEVGLAGSLLLSRGTLVLGSLGQQLSDVHGRLTLADDKIRLEGLQVRDFDGRLTVDGQFTFTGLHKLDTELELDLKNFSIRRESAQVSRLTGRMTLHATTTAERTRAELKVGDLRVNLPNDLGQGLQALDEHPDIAVRGKEVREPELHPHEVELRLLAQNPPFRVLRSDLTALVTTDLTVRYRAPELTLQGNAAIKRGTFELYGKRFELRESRVAFDGSDQLDPLVSIEAVHQSGSDEIGVHVEGRASAPKISFTSTNPALTEPGAIIAQLLGARTTDASSQNLDASGAAAGILAGATAGLLTQEVRNEFGGAIPVLSLESNSQTLSTARIRAGVQLDELINRRLGKLSKVVRGAYVEGFVAPGATTVEDNPAIAPQSRSGGLLELTFPKDLVGTIEYRPPQNWRLDLAWEP